MIFLKESLGKEFAHPKKGKGPGGQLFSILISEKSI